MSELIVSKTLNRVWLQGISAGLGKGPLYCNYVSCIFLQVAHNIKTTRELQLRKKEKWFSKA